MRCPPALRPQLRRDSLGGSMTTIRVNTLKARPALQYLVADAGLEAPSISLQDGWKIFQTYLRLPSDSPEDLAGFQATWIREGSEEPVLEVLFARQLTDKAATYGPITRVVALQFLIEGVSADVRELEVWSSDFPSFDRFLDHVEKLPEFQHALDGSLIQGDVILYDERIPDEGAAA